MNRFQLTNKEEGFCDPHSPWRRASCENTNGLIHRYRPKGTDPSVQSQEQLEAIADLLNNGPRAVHGLYPPIVAYQAMMDGYNRKKAFRPPGQTG